MKKKVPIESFFILLILLILLPASDVHAWPIPYTGQTKYYNNSAEVPCPQPGHAFYGQDGNYNINPLSYTELEANDNALPNSATTWTTIRDKVRDLDMVMHDGCRMRFS